MNIEKLKNILKVNSFVQLVIVLVVFSITGSLSLFLSDYALSFLKVDKENFSLLFYYFLRICLLFPIYQILLILVGTLFW